MAKKKKKGYGKVLGFCAIVGCVAALFWGAGYFGFGGGILPWAYGDGTNGTSNGNGNNNGAYTAQDNQYQDTSQVDPDETANIPGEDEVLPPVLIIRVTRGEIYHGDRQISIYELVPILEELNQPGYVWELHDDQAIVETYENVIALMRESGVYFTER
ncbi:MAG: hypothetical protein FWC92_00445 [Defluviitaleaceae bacterium]|nr:hypothetical protein [Defluviitaleaceae bacterium]